MDTFQQAANRLRHPSLIFLTRMRTERIVRLCCGWHWPLMTFISLLAKASSRQSPMGEIIQIEALKPQDRSRPAGARPIGGEPRVA
jgi:hypothetical protein